MTCRLEGCDRKLHADGWCKTHYLRVCRYGTPTPVTARLDPIGYFWSRVDKGGPQDCWIWMPQRDSGGYGLIGARTGFTASGTRMAHRVAYELTHGVVIPEDLHLDHLCRNPPCCNPAHLEPVTVKENVRRGKNGVLRTHCSKGHALTDANTYVRPSDNARKCRICSRNEMRARRGSSLAEEA